MPRRLVIVSAMQFLKSYLLIFDTFVRVLRDSNKNAVTSKINTIQHMHKEVNLDLSE